MGAFLMSSGLDVSIVKPCGLHDGAGGQNMLVVGHDDDMVGMKPPLVARADVARVMLHSLLHPEEAAGLRFDLCSKAGPPTTDVAALIKASRYSWQSPADVPDM